MNKKLFNLIALFSVFILVLTGCTQQGKLGEPFKHKTPLIKENIKKSGKKEIQKTVDMGPSPVEGDVEKL